MIKLGNLPLNGIPRIAVGFKDKTASSALLDAKNFGLDIAELRIDQYSHFDKKYVLQEIDKFKNFPTIATLRSKNDGGHWPLSEHERLELFASIIPKVDAVDIELSAKDILPDVVRFAHEKKKLVIISYHNFAKTPEELKLSDICHEAKSLGADVVKIATIALNQEDVKTLAAFTISHSNKNLITISMGSLGVVSRVLFPALGSLITYAYLGDPAAPGQLPYDKTFDSLRILYPNYNQEKISLLQSRRDF